MARVANLALLAAALVVVSLACTAAAKRPTWDKLDGYTFEAYKRDFGKVYDDVDEHDFRRTLFEAKLEAIRRHNNAALSSYKKGVNQFTDLTEKEFRQRLGYRKDIGYLRRGNGKEGPSESPREVALPSSVDWRKEGVVTPVKDQGNCGSCWSFASAETLESQWAIATGLLQTLSEQNILSCTPNPLECGGSGGCGGGTAELAYSTLVQRGGGIASEWVYPYLSYRGKNYNCNATTKMPLAAQVSGLYKLPPNQQTPLLQAVATVGPIAISVDASEWSEYESGVFDGCNGTYVDINHAVQLVGYGTDSKGGDYWLVRNSWGPTYGEQGYIRVARPSSPPCVEDITPSDGTGCIGGPSSVRVCGVCGILYDSCYPEVNKTVL